MGSRAPSPATGLRLADVLAALSLATDLGVGAPMETALRTCLLATALGQRLGLGGAELATVYFAALMRHLGCTAWAHEAAELAGDDHDLLRTFEGVDRTRKSKLLGRAVARLAPGQPAGARVLTIARVLTQPSAGNRLAAAQCAQAEALAEDLGLGPAVVTALAQMYERHDGRGGPHHLRGEQISLAGQLIHLAQVLEALLRQLGPARALAELEGRRGTQFSAAVVDAALGSRDLVTELASSATLWEQVLAIEPAPVRTVELAHLPQIALAFARFADLKSPHRVGHSPAVAALADRAAERAGLSAENRTRLRISALLHDLGTVSVSNATWDHAGALGASAWEQVRLHAHYGERILARSPLTQPFAALVGGHHERMDGSGYHRNARGDSIEQLARILGAADCWVALTSRRPHRDALAAPDASQCLTREASAGRLCRDAVALVQAAAGQPVTRAALPAGLTEREAEVLRHLARGLVSKEIASVLGIATRTVKHHIEHIYEKTGVTTRAAAALFAARNDLVGPD